MSPAENTNRTIPDKHLIEIFKKNWHKHFKYSNILIWNLEFPNKHLKHIYRWKFQGNNAKTFDENVLKIFGWNIQRIHLMEIFSKNYKDIPI